MDDEYSQILKLIREVEASYAKKEVAFVNISDIISGKSISEQKPDYQSVMQLVYSVEPARVEHKAVQKPVQLPQAVGYTEAQAPQLATQEQQPPEQPVTAAQAIIGVEKEILPAIQKVKAKTKKEIQEALPAIQGVKAKAEKEIRELASKIPSAKSMMKFRHINVADLVLPTLSISDQVSELERIIEGLRENMFDQEHLAIVSQEVYGLQQEANRAAKELKKSHAELNATDQTLFSMREQRLNDAIALLVVKGAG